MHVAFGLTTLLTQSVLLLLPTTLAGHALYRSVRAEPLRLALGPADACALRLARALFHI